MRIQRDGRADRHWEPVHLLWYIMPYNIKHHTPNTERATENSEKYKQSRLGAGKRKLANHVRVYYSIMILALVGSNVCELNQ